MEQPLLSVIVPVYNLRDYLDQCVASILGQSWRNLELWLIDDGSTDGSDALCDAWEQRDARVRVWHQKNGGLSVARNAGLDRATGEWITFVDGDDWLDPNMLETLVKLAMNNQADIAACTCNYVFPERTEAAGSTGLISVFNRKEALERLVAQREVRFEAWAKVYRRDAVGEIRFLPGQIYEDIHFARRLLQKIRRYVYIDRPGYQYRQQRPGNTNSSFSERKLGIIPECDEFAAELRGEGMTVAAAGMEAFTLDHIIRMYVNALSCGASPEILARLKSAYRERYKKTAANPYVRRVRGGLFALSPRAYYWLSQRIHPAHDIG